MLNNYINQIICDDCINAANYLQKESIDLIITSPPYNVKLGDNKYNKRPYDLYNDNKDHKEYIDWLMHRMATIIPLLKEGARVCINIGDGKNGRVPTHVDVVYRMTNMLGFLPMTTILWDKHNCSNRTSWGSWMSPSNPSFPTPIEYILVFAHKTYKKEGNKDDITISKKEFIDFSLGKWTFPGVKHPVHPAPFPRELPYRLIQMLSYRGDVVYDPFMGIGTTLTTAKEIGRKYVGTDISQQYVDITIKALNDTKTLL